MTIFDLEAGFILVSYLFYNKRFLRNLASVDKAIFLRFQFQHYKIVNFQSLQRKREPRMIFDGFFVSMRKTSMYALVCCTFLKASLNVKRDLLAVYIC